MYKWEAMTVRLPFRTDLLITASVG